MVLNGEMVMRWSRDRAGSLGEREEECVDLVNLETVVLCSIIHFSQRPDV